MNVSPSLPTVPNVTTPVVPEGSPLFSMVPSMPPVDKATPIMIGVTWSLIVLGFGVATVMFKYHRIRTWCGRKCHAGHPSTDLESTDD